MSGHWIEFEPHPRHYDFPDEPEKGLIWIDDEYGYEWTDPFDYKLAKELGDLDDDEEEF